MDYSVWQRSLLKQALDFTRLRNVHPESNAIYFSGPSRAFGVQPVRNKTRAFNHAVRDGGVLLDRTDRGDHLSKRHRIIKHHAKSLASNLKADRLVAREWSMSSIDFANQSHGRITAYVVGASKTDVFRNFELPILINNPRVQTINGIPRNVLKALEARKGEDHVFRAVALAQIHNDLRQGIRTANQKLIHDALWLQQVHQAQTALETGSPYKSISSYRADVEQRSKRLASIIKDSLRLSALRAVRSYTTFRVDQGTMQPETAEDYMRRSARILHDPRHVFRVGQLAVLKLQKAKLDANPQPVIREVHDFLNAQRQYVQDLRAARQADGDMPIMVDPATAAMSHRHIRRSMTARARLKRNYRPSNGISYASAHAELDLRLQDQRRVDEGKTARPNPRPSSPNAAAHSFH